MFRIWIEADAVGEVSHKTVDGDPLNRSQQTGNIEGVYEKPAQDWPSGGFPVADHHSSLRAVARVSSFHYSPKPRATCGSGPERVSITEPDIKSCGTLSTYCADHVLYSATLKATRSGEKGLDAISIALTVDLRRNYATN